MGAGQFNLVIVVNVYHHTLYNGLIKHNLLHVITSNRYKLRSIIEPSILRASTSAYIVAHLPCSTLKQAHVQQVSIRCNNFVHEPE